MLWCWGEGRRHGARCTGRKRRSWSTTFEIGKEGIKGSCRLCRMTEREMVILDPDRQTDRQDCPKDSPEFFNPFFATSPEKRSARLIYFGSLRNCWPPHDPSIHPSRGRTLGHGNPLEFTQTIPSRPISEPLRALGSPRQGTGYTDHGGCHST